MIYDIVIHTALYPNDLAEMVRKSVDNYQSDNLVVEVQYAGGPSTTYSAMVIARKPNG